MGKIWENLHPLVFAIFGAILAVLFSPDLFKFMKSQDWQIGNIYTSTFDIFAIFTAFAFTFYTFIITSESGFIGRSKKSIYYKRLVKYVLNAIISGFLLVVISAPLTVVQPKPIAYSIDLYFVAFWFGLVIYNTFAFIRAAKIFSEFSQQHH